MKTSQHSTSIRLSELELENLIKYKDLSDRKSKGAFISNCVCIFYAFSENIKTRKSTSYVILDKGNGFENFFDAFAYFDKNYISIYKNKREKSYPYNPTEKALSLLKKLEENHKINKTHIIRLSISLYIFLYKQSNLNTTIDLIDTNNTRKRVIGNILDLKYYDKKIEKASAAFELYATVSKKFTKLWKQNKIDEILELIKSTEISFKNEDTDESAIIETLETQSIVFLEPHSWKTTLLNPTILLNPRHIIYDAEKDIIKIRTSFLGKIPSLYANTQNRALAFLRSFDPLASRLLQPAEQRPTKNKDLESKTK